MTYIGRHRERVSKREYGYLHVNGGTDVFPLPLNYDSCVDAVGNYDGVNPLSIVHTHHADCGTISSKYPQFATLDRKPFENQAFNYSGHVIVPSTPNDTATITEVMARTNPSRPEVSLPQLIAELRDIPGMLHMKGRKTIEGMPRSSAVAYNFGWAPLIQDLLKMADFTKHVDDRLDELKRLHSSKGLSRSRTVFSQTALGQDPPTAFHTSWGHSVGGYVTYHNITKKWGNVHWIPDVPFTGTQGELAQRARLLVHGWDLSSAAIASTLWELLPWSWFIDYFLNVGDYLMANRNGANVVASIGCVMQHARSSQKQVINPVTLSSNAVAHAGSLIYETKSRVLVTAGITATIPFLSAGQLVTMSSLAQSLSRG